MCQMLLYTGSFQTTSCPGTSKTNAGRSVFSPRNHSSTCRALPSSTILVKTRCTASCTRRSGSISTLPLRAHRKPTGNRNWSSPRRAFWRIASNDRCRSKFSSNSLHPSFKPQQEPIIEDARIVDAIWIDYDGAHQAAEFDEMMPVSAVTGQAGSLNAKDGANLSRTDFRDQMLEPGAFHLAGTRAPKILVDYLD